MSKKPVRAFIMALFVVIVAAQAWSADDLFDTAAASKHMEKGIAFLNAKKFDAAVREFDEAAAINPEAEAYYYLGYAYYLKGRSGDEESRKKSREYFAKTYEIDPNFSPNRLKPTEPAPGNEITRSTPTADHEELEAAQEKLPATAESLPPAPATAPSATI